MLIRYTYTHTPVSYTHLFLFLVSDLKRAEKNGEGFMDTGAAYDATVRAPTSGEERLPPLWLSVIPLLVAILLATVFQLDIVIALFVGVILAIACFWNYMPTIKKTLGDGVTSAFGPVAVS